jgi:hypothetical protein
MTDDLVKRLREEVNDHMFGIIQSPLQLEAADRVEQLEREKAAWLEAYGGAVLELTERNKEMEAALREVCSIPAQKRGSASHAMLVIAAAALGEKKDGRN